jgi:transposase
MRRSRRQLRQLAQGHEVLQAQGAVIGLPTACVLWSCVGDPHHYESGGAYRKAMGLNLVERSSGMYEGKLRLSKRGSSRARQWLYFAALRLVQKAGVSQWYQAKKARDNDEAKRALVAVMRRLVLALHAVGTRGETFELRRLFPQTAQRRAKSGSGASPNPG